MNLTQNYWTVNVYNVNVFQLRYCLEKNIFGAKTSSSIRELALLLRLLVSGQTALWPYLGEQRKRMFSASGK